RGSKRRASLPPRLAEVPVFDLLLYAGDELLPEREVGCWAAGVTAGEGTTVGVSRDAAVARRVRVSLPVDRKLESLFSEEGDDPREPREAVRVVPLPDWITCFDRNAACVVAFLRPCGVCELHHLHASALVGSKGGVLARVNQMRTRVVGGVLETVDH